MDEKNTGSPGNLPDSEQKSVPTADSAGDLHVGTPMSADQSISGFTNIDKPSLNAESVPEAPQNAQPAPDTAQITPNVLQTNAPSAADTAQITPNVLQANVQSTADSTRTEGYPSPDAVQANSVPEPPVDVCPPLLEILDVNKSYSGQKVLKGLSFTIGRGGVIGLLGPNGSGKTTALKLIAGLLVPDSGSIRINGQAPSPETASSVAFLPERDFLPSGAKVSYLVDYFADFFADFDRRKAYEMLGRLGVNEKARMRTLSKGTREKVRLILVMSRRAELYLLDEPLGGVDPAAREYILDTIFSNYSAGCSILISTHLISDIERGLNDVIFMADGRAAFCASVRSIREKYGKSVDELFREVYRC